MTEVGDLGVVDTPKGLKVVLPSGAGCYYVDRDHSYWRLKADGDRGTRLTGVTTIAKVLDTDPSKLLAWAARTNGIGIAQLAAPVIARLREGAAVAAEDLAWLESAQAIWTRLESEKLTFEDVREERAVVGTNVHELAFRALAAGKPVPDLDQLTDEERGYAEAVMAFWLDHDPAASHVEQIVVDPGGGVAGRFDFLGELRERCLDVGCPCHDFLGPGILDAKTGFVGPSSHAQIAGYWSLCETSGLPEPAWSAILRLAGDGTYRLERGQAGPEDFRHALAAYRAAGRIKRDSAKAYRARQDGGR